MNLFLIGKILGFGFLLLVLFWAWAMCRAGRDRGDEELDESDMDDESENEAAKIFEQEQIAGLEDYWGTMEQFRRNL